MTWGIPMEHTFSIEVWRDGAWVVARNNLSATLAAFAIATATLRRPGELWRAVRDDGVILGA